MEKKVTVLRRLPSGALELSSEIITEGKHINGHIIVLMGWNKLDGFAIDTGRIVIPVSEL
jgi:hypothetical protein